MRLRRARIATILGARLADGSMPTWGRIILYDDGELEFEGPDSDFARELWEVRRRRWKSDDELMTNIEDYYNHAASRCFVEVSEKTILDEGED